jgi:hypothetical protein
MDLMPIEAQGGREEAGSTNKERRTPVKVSASSLLGLIDYWPTISK